MTILVVALRELRAGFTTPSGWLVLCGWVVVTGLFWTAMLENYVIQSQESVFNPYGAAQLTLADWLIGPYLGNCAVLLLMALPAVTMRLFSEEIRSGTLELLLTSPISTFEIVMGKYLAAMGVLLLLLATAMRGPALLFAWGNPEPGVVLGGVLSLLLLGCAAAALGLLASAFTANQTVAMMATFGAAIGMLALGWLSRDPDDLPAQLSLLGHMQSMLQGAPKLSDIVYYLGFAGACLFAAHQRIESHRWH